MLSKELQVHDFPLKSLSFSPPEIIAASNGPFSHIIVPSVDHVISQRERPLMTSDFRVGRGVQNDPKIGRFRVEKGR